MPRYNTQDPVNDRLSKLAAIAQIYGQLSGPQHQQEELARQQQRDQQYLALQLMQMHQQGQYQQGEMSHGADALAQQERLRTDAITARQQELTARDDDNFTRSALAMGDPKIAGYLNQAQVNRDPSVPLSRQFAQYQHQGQVGEAQNAWNTTIAPGIVAAKTPEAKAQVYNSFLPKYGQYVNSGEVDFSQGLPPDHATAIASSLPTTIPQSTAGQVGQLFGQGYGGELSQYGDMAKMAANYTAIPAYNFLAGLFGGQEKQPY